MKWCPLNTYNECPDWGGPCTTNMARDCPEVRGTMIFKSPELHNDEQFCNSTPMGERWPVCSLYKDHRDRHESADFFWYTGGPAIMKGTEYDPSKLKSDS